MSIIIRDSAPFVCGEDPYHIVTVIGIWGMANYFKWKLTVVAQYVLKG